MVQGRKSPALAQLRGQPGVTTRNVSSFSYSPLFVLCPESCLIVHDSSLIAFRCCHAKVRHAELCAPTRNCLKTAPPLVCKEARIFFCRMKAASKMHEELVVMSYELNEG